MGRMMPITQSFWNQTVVTAAWRCGFPEDHRNCTLYTVNFTVWIRVHNKAVRSKMNKNQWHINWQRDSLICMAFPKLKGILLRKKVPQDHYTDGKKSPPTRQWPVGAARGRRATTAGQARAQRRASYQRAGKGAIYFLCGWSDECNSEWNAPFKKLVFTLTLFCKPWLFMWGTQKKTSIFF